MRLFRLFAPAAPALLLSLSLILILGCGSAPRGSGPPAMPASAPARSAPLTPASAPPHLACKDQRAWGSYLKRDTRAAVADILDQLTRAGVALTDEQRQALGASLEPMIKWRLIRFLLVDGDNHNFGVVELPALTTAEGAPVRIYRTGFTPMPDQPGSCFRSLLDHGGVRHVVSLYAGAMPTQDLEAAEQRAAQAAGATYFTARAAPRSMSSWRRDIDEHAGDPARVRAAMNAVATLINEHILRPGGAPPRGNIHIHCGGGMHRTGMIVGILERCIAGAAMADIEAEYKRHVDWRGEESPGGYEPGNIDFIRNFDCSLLIH